MKKSLFLYLFILAVLMNVFTYAYFSKEAQFEKEHSATLSKKLGDSIVALTNKAADNNYFSLENDQNAQNYLEMSAVNGRYVPYDKLIPLVNEKLIAFNDNPEGNPYTGQDKLGAQKFIINKAKLLNHRWIIADYSNGEFWGEVLLKYFVNPDESVNFVVVDTFLFPKETN